MESQSSLIIQSPRAQEHAAQCRITMSENGWDVSVEVDERVLSVTHCGDWHRVERVCGPRKKIFNEAHTLAPDRR
jgi:hypothetical protein